VYNQSTSFKVEGVDLASNRFIGFTLVIMQQWLYATKIFDLDMTEMFLSYADLDAILNIDCEAQSSVRNESAAPTVTALSSKCIEHFIPVE
jgi:hypothetical protein